MASNKRKTARKKPVSRKAQGDRKASSSAVPRNVKKIAPAKTGAKRMVKKPKPKAKFHIGSFVVLVFVVSILVFVIESGYSALTKKTIATVSINTEAIDTQDGIYKGIIIRDEKTLAGNSKGNVRFIVNDKERIKKDTEILQIRNDNEAIKLEDTIKSINTAVYDTQNRRGDYSLFYTEAKKINEQIQDNIEKTIYKAAGSDTSVVYALKESVEKNMAIRNQMMLTENKGSAESYTEERSHYEGELRSHVKSMYSTEAGIISYVTDGMEDIYTFENRTSLSKEEVNMKPDQISDNSNKEVEAGEAVYRLVTSNNWYIACYIENAVADLLSENSGKIIYLEQDESFIPMESVIEKIEKGTEESYVLFKLTKNIIDFMDIRNISFKLNDSVYNGYKIPSSAIVERTFLKIPNKYIYNERIVSKRNAEGKSNGIAITVSRKGSGEDEGYSYVFLDFSGLVITDTIINPENPEDVYEIKETKTLRGVYKANNNIAKFYEINEESSVVSGGYILIDPEKNKGLSLYDKIIAEADDITENQIIN